jgi:hypothetical protein
MPESLANLSKILVHTPNNSKASDLLVESNMGIILTNNFINVDPKIDRVQHKRRLIIMSVCHIYPKPTYLHSIHAGLYSTY